jgi:hypothetical protein
MCRETPFYTGTLHSPTLACISGDYYLNPIQMEKAIVTKNQHGTDQLPFIVEGKPFNWPEQYITGAQIKALAGLPGDGELFLSISDPWKDEPIGDDESVDLARPEKEQFFIRKKLDYTINGVVFSSNKQYIKGSKIREQGCIATDEEIYLKVPKDWEDELIEDNEWVDLARPGKEYFVSRKIAIAIVVNGSLKNWNAKTITYEQVVKLAYPASTGGENFAYTVNYTNGPKQNPEGTMTKGETIFVKNKTNFNVTETSRS